MPFPPALGSFKIDFHGMDLVRSRDCVVFVKDDLYTVRVDAAMLQSGWAGGQGVQWVGATTDEFTVTYSSGLFGGFLIWGSDESADQYTSMTRSSLAYDHAVMVSGSVLLSTSTYERYTWASRQAGPLVPLVYSASDALFFSLRGLWTKEDELTLSGNGLAPALETGYVSQVPQPATQHFLGIQATL